jgi:type I restriction enzyme M protein
VITLKGGLFFSTPTAACIIILNNNKQKNHKNKICMIDATEIYTPQRAQIQLSDDNINEVYSLCDNYSDVIEKAKVVSLDDVKNAGYSLSSKLYTDKKARESIDIEHIKNEFYATIKEVEKCENELKMLVGKYYEQ